MAWYKWVFDGIGAAVFVGLCGFLYRWLSKRRGQISGAITANDVVLLADGSSGSAVVTAQMLDSQLAVGNNISQSVEVHHYHGATVAAVEIQQTRPSPREILDAVRSAMPFDEDQVRAKYSGLEIVWRLRLESIKQFE
jgi:hypothetical protein